ncbi:MAG TPA: hypothetical protein VFS40_06790 [Gemmatimonadales bacterium]|nr:hypothetical protein [Gemmatimonadales bacterium]
MRPPLRGARAGLVAAGLLLGAAAAPGCASRPATVRALPAPDPAAEGIVSDVIARALEADARFSDPAGLYAPFAGVVADGEERFTFPRFAGVDSGGQIAVTASEISVHPTLAWADVDYRWVAAGATAVHPGRATFILAPSGTGAGWWIVHAHSSTPRPR